jgi:hypothetical protein
MRLEASLTTDDNKRAELQTKIDEYETELTADREDLETQQSRKDQAN